MSNLYIEKVTDSAIEPVKGTDHAACYDVHADTKSRHIALFGLKHETSYSNGGFISIRPSERALIPTGLKMCCDEGYRVAMYPRSGLSIKLGVNLVNCTGVIDADYRGEVMIPLINLSNETVTIKHGERIAQIALEKLEPTELIYGLPDTTSNRSGGFGSTGK